MAKKTPKATKIIVLRHAEKPAKDGPPYGVTRAGKRSKESLEVRGWQRAGALANLLAPSDGHFQSKSLATPEFLFASRPLQRRGSRRSKETITPLAKKLGIEINLDFARAEFEEMLDQVFACKGVVLICWQQEYIPNIAAHILGSRKIAPRDWPEDRYDLVWVFDLNLSSRKYTFRQVPQMLLTRDSRTPIK